MAVPGGFRILGELEREIMALFWRDGIGTGRSIWQQLRQMHPVAYTTVMTVIAHLVGKGILVPDMPRGARAHARRFGPALTKEELMQQAVRQMWDDLDATEAERRQLIEALRE